MLASSSGIWTVESGRGVMEDVRDDPVMEEVRDDVVIEEEGNIRDRGL